MGRIIFLKEKNKILSKLILCGLLISIFSSFLEIFVYIPRYDIFFHTYDDKMEEIDPSYYGVLVFVKNNVENGSIVLFFNFPYYILGKPFLYPEINSSYKHYSNDQDLLIYLKEKSHIKNFLIIFLCFL